MKITEFLLQSPKKMAEDFKANDIKSYKNVPDTIDKLCKEMKLTKDDTLKNYRVSTYRGDVTLNYTIEMDLGELIGVKEVNFSIGFSGALKKYYNYKIDIHPVGKWSSRIYLPIYGKVCGIFDERDDYHNLEFDVPYEKWVGMESSGWKDDLVPVFNPEIPLNEYMEEFCTIANPYMEVINEIEPLFFNGGYQESYNKFNFTPFPTGNMIMGIRVGFSSCVRSILFAKENYGYHLTMDNIQALYKYMCNKTKERKEDENSMSAKIYNLFYNEDKLIDVVTKDDLLSMIDIATKEYLIDNSKEQFASVYKKINKEYHFAKKQLREELAKKYDLDISYINQFGHYDEETDRGFEWSGDTPIEYKDRYQ